MEKNVLKVLQINSVCGYGSTGRIAVDLYHALENQGHECCIAYGRGSAPEGIKTIKIGSKADFYLHVLYARIFDGHGFASKKATNEFIQKAKLYNPDVIHLHNIHGYFINIELLFEYLREADVPIIWTLHDCWNFTGHCAHFDPINCDKWKEQCEKCQLKRVYPQRWFFDNSRKNYLRKRKCFSDIKKMIFVTPSKWLASMVQQSFLKDYNVITIPNGIDLRVFQPLDELQIPNVKKILSEKYKIDFSKKIFLGVASVWTRDKGFEDFINIAHMELEDIQIVLVGINKKQKRILPSNMIGIERTENKQELAALYACSDVFLNPTYADTFPTVNMEAMACGLPVIAYKTGGSTEIADIAVEKGDYTELAYTALEYLKSNIKTDRSTKLLDNDTSMKKYLELINTMSV